MKPIGYAKDIAFIVSVFVAGVAIFGALFCQIVRFDLSYQRELASGRADFVLVESPAKFYAENSDADEDDYSNYVSQTLGLR